MKQSRVKPWVVYCLIQSDGTPFYVGVTRNLARRMKEHGTTLGSKPQYRELEHGTSDRGEAEHRWIETFRADGFVLTNKTAGGNGWQGLGPEARALVSAFQKGRPKSDQHRAKIKAALKGNTPAWSPEGLERAKASRFQPGNNSWAGLTEEQRVKRISSLHPLTSEATSRASTAHWAALTPEERTERLRKMHSARDPDRLREAALNASRAASASPTAGKKISQARKAWWANMTPEDRADFLARRTIAIAAAKARKKAAR